MTASSRLRASLAVTFVSCALLACSPITTSDDAGRDASTRVDAAPQVDAAQSDDAASPDASGTDAAEGDAASDREDAGGPPVTTIRIVYPNGAAIALRGSGDPLDWTTGVDTVALGGGVYELRTTEITAPLEWKPLLDDTTWSLGPNYHVEPGQTIEVAPHFMNATGRVISLSDLSAPGLARAHPIWAYLPPVYDENDAARLPVVYMHDGQNLFDPALAFGGTEWGVDEAFDEAAGSGRCIPSGATCQSDGDCGASRCETFREALVIGIGNTAERIFEYTPTIDASIGDGGGADAYLSAIVSTLKPAIDGSMRTLDGREDTALLGSSLGGLVSAYGGVTHADTFGLVGAMSPSTWWDDRVLLTEVATIPSLPVRTLRVYVDSGDAGPSSDGVADTADLAAAYETAGYVEGTSLSYLVAPGHQHSEGYWRMRLPGALAFLLGPREREVP
jgi:predicted alpha/beta superfamily hydrolase